MRPDSIFNVLAGTYVLLNTSTTQNGVPVPDEAYGKNPSGILVYTKSGFVTATITSTDAKDRPEGLTFPPQAGQSDADWANVARHLIAYAGPVTVSDAIPATETSGQIFHGPLTVAHVPAWVGQMHRRNYTLFENGRLLKIGSKRDGGNEGTLWWRRMD